MIKRGFWVAILAAFAMTLPVAGIAQVVSRPYGGSRPGQSAHPPRSSKDADKLLATFTGTVSSITKKDLFVKTDDGNTLQFSRSGKTEFTDGSKKINASHLKSGQPVSIQAKVNIDGSLAAVAVAIQHPKK
jgi:hypothetical protein